MQGGTESHLFSALILELLLFYFVLFLEYVLNPGAGFEPQLKEDAGQKP